MAPFVHDFKIVFRNEFCEVPHCSGINRVFRSYLVFGKCNLLLRVRKIFQIIHLYLFNYYSGAQRIFFLITITLEFFPKTFFMKINEINF